MGLAGQTELTNARRVLGLPLSGPLTLDEVKKAGRKKALRHHPDRPGSSSYSAVDDGSFNAVMEAWEVLADWVKESESIEPEPAVDAPPEQDAEIDIGTRFSVAALEIDGQEVPSQGVRAMLEFFDDAYQVGVVFPEPLSRPSSSTVSIVLMLDGDVVAALTKPICGRSVDAAGRLQGLWFQPVG